MKDQIIKQLKASKQYLSGEEISKTFHLSRAAIWKTIEELRREGYVIEAIPHRGYQLKSTPDKLLPREIKDKLKTQYIGHEIHYYDSVPSTMNVAFDLAVNDAKEGVVVCSETQTQGRGRMNRLWSSPEAQGIYMSIILRPRLAITDVAKLNLMLAVAIVEAVFETTQVQAKIKWPNDLLIDGKKLAGLLTEMSAEMDRLKFIVAGIGLNVNSLSKDLPENSTSIKEHSHKQICRVKLMQNILYSIEQWYEIVQESGFDFVIRKWKEYSVTLGSRVKLIDYNGELEGEAIDLDEYGGLMIRNDQGVTVKRMSGDIVQV